MPAVEILTLATNGIDLLAKLMPILSKIQAGGTATVEDQAAVKAAYNQFVANGDEMFNQPHWKIE